MHFVPALRKYDTADSASEGISSVTSLHRKQASSPLLKWLLGILMAFEIAIFFKLFLHAYGVAA
jgi:hypothetical protein